MHKNVPPPRDFPPPPLGTLKGGGLNAPPPSQINQHATAHIYIVYVLTLSKWRQLLGHTEEGGEGDCELYWISNK